MNYRAIIKNKDGSIDFIEVKNSIIVGKNFSKNGVKISNKNYIQDILDKLFYNDNCELLGYSNDFKIYYDKETNLKHFLKNGVEDLELFIQYNGTDATRYLGKKTKRALVSIVCAGVMVIIGITDYVKNTVNLEHDIAYYDYNIAESVEKYSNISADNLDEYMAIDYTDALRYIEESNLPEEAKQILSNEDLLKDVFSCYKNTLLEYSAINKFKGINIQTFESKSNDAKLYGRYSILFPNMLELNTEIIGTEKYGPTLAHEFIHMLQAEGLKYDYIVEGTDDLVKTEYYDYPSDSYKEAEKNMRLMMDIIGPEPIIKMLFSGDDDQFINIIKNNLSEEDAKELLSLLSTPAGKFDSVENLHEKIEELLRKLYKSINGQDIENDIDIMYGTLYENNSIGGSVGNNRHYFNLRKMEDIEPVTVYEKKEVLLEKGMIEEKNMVTYKKHIDDLEEYKSLIEDETISLSYKNNFKYERTLYGVIDSKNNCFFLFDTPLKEGEYNDNEGYIDIDITKMPGHNISLHEAYEKGYIIAIAHKTLPEEETIEEPGWSPYTQSVEYVSNNPNIEIINMNSMEGLVCITINRPGIKVKFEDQYNNLCNIILREENFISNRMQ